MGVKTVWLDWTWVAVEVYIWGTAKKILKEHRVYMYVYLAFGFLSLSIKRWDKTPRGENRLTS